MHVHAYMWHVACIPMLMHLNAGRRRRRLRSECALAVKFFIFSLDTNSTLWICCVSPDMVGRLVRIEGEESE